MIFQRTLVLALLSLALAACGGGGGGGDGGGTPPTTTPPPGGGSPNNPPPPTPLPEPADWDQYSAEHARVQMGLIETLLSITWFDLFENELGYQVERRVGDGDWEVLEVLPAMHGGFGLWWQQVPAAARYRVTVVLEGRTIALHSPGNEPEIAIDPGPADRPTIHIDQPEPVRGPVQVSVQNADTAAAVTYTFEGGVIARVTGGGSFPATLPAQQLIDGEGQIRIFVEKSPGLTLSRIRALQVDNPAPAIVLMPSNSSTLDGPVQLTTHASADAGISSVEFFVNGASVHVAHAPVPTTDQYIFTVHSPTLLPGENVFRVVATDSTMATASMERAVTVNAAPTLNVTGLSNGMTASGGRLSFTGTFSDDASGSNLTIDLGDRRVLRTRNSPFAVDFSLAGVPAGERTVNLRVQDSIGKVTSRSYTIIVP